jgi:ABC-type dipeptide/oligopeptide/nickel transport system permease component
VHIALALIEKESMKTFIIRRAFMTVVLLFLVALTVFLLGFLTGDPVRLMVPEEASQQQIDDLRRELGLDRPLVVQFASFLRGALVGDLGQSLRYRQPALTLVLERMPATIELSTIAMAIALLLAIPTGIISALRRGSFLDGITTVTAVVGQALPPFWIGIMLIIVFAVQLRWLPATGRGDWGSVILPAITLGLWPMARLSRVLRSSLLDVLEEDYVRTARAKGLSERIVLLRHALRNAAIPVVTVAALTYGSILGGAVITEQVFAWPGVGRLALEAVYNRDFPLVRATVLVAAFVFVIINFALDLVYAWLDPRIRLR